MSSRRGFVAFPLITAVLFTTVLVIGLMIFRPQWQQSLPSPDVVGPVTKELVVFAEEIPGSRFHSPDATWWGYNQNKIVRFGNNVFMYVIDNQDDKNTTTSDFVVYKKEANGPWIPGARFPASRPGNILIDSTGVLHAFVFEPFDVTTNDSWGKLKHYWFPNASSGDIMSYQEETVVDNDGTSETVNIRVGAAIGADDTMAVAFGLTTFNPQYRGHSEHVYLKKPTDTVWTHLIAGENLGHDFYYPFVVATNDRLYLLPVQDDYNQGKDGVAYDNIYQKILYFEYKNGAWGMRMIADLSDHALAASRPRLLEQEELFIDQDGTVHILYKEFLDPEFQWRVTNHRHMTIVGDEVKTQRMDVGGKDAQWVRLFEVDGVLYRLVTTFDEVWIGKLESGVLAKVEIPSEAKGFYPYVATAKGGTKDHEAFIDILLLASDQKLYAEGKNVNTYLRIPKSEFSTIQ